MRKLIRAVKAALQAEYIRWFGYTVVVHWEGERFEHKACTERGALDWVRCYGTDADVFVYEFDRAAFGRSVTA